MAHGTSGDSPLGRASCSRATTSPPTRRRLGARRGRCRRRDVGTPSSQRASAPQCRPGLARAQGRRATTPAPQRAKLFASAERRVELDRERELKTAEAVAERLGQHEGRVDEAGPDGQLRGRWRCRRRCGKHSAQLQSNAPPMSAELAAQVIERRPRRATRATVRGVGPSAHRRRQHRPGAPRGHHRPRSPARSARSR
jgi:hypothetical protein